MSSAEENDDGELSAKTDTQKTIAEGTLAFYFAQPAGFIFKAGQCAQFTLNDPSYTDDEGSRHYFTLASTPDEPELMLATRIRNSAFKKMLSSLDLGATLTMKGPYGDFTLPDNAKRSLVFITGGIGVTPVRSRLLHAIANKLPQYMTLFYANRRPEYAALLDELTQACANITNTTLIATMSQAALLSLPWQGEQGYVDQAMLARYLNDLKEPIYYLDGPPELGKSY